MSFTRGRPWIGSFDRTGKVVLESGIDDGGIVVVDTIGAGDLLGWSWMFPPRLAVYRSGCRSGSRRILRGPVLREYAN
jgi:hypothetical protein